MEQDGVEQAARSTEDQNAWIGRDEAAQQQLQAEPEELGQAHYEPAAWCKRLVVFILLELQLARVAWLARSWMGRWLATRCLAKQPG